MRILPGTTASPGVAIGESLIIDREGFRIPRRYIARGAVDDEVRRLDEVLAAVADELARNRDVISRQLGDQYGAIFAAHLRMLRDPRLFAEVTELIRSDYFSAEFAVSQTIHRYAQVFQQSSSSYLAERAHDLYDIERHLLRKLFGLGLRELSVPPAVIPEIKKAYRSVTLRQCEVVSRRALTMDSAREIDNFLREELRKAAPELVNNERGP